MPLGRRALGRRQPWLVLLCAVAGVSACERGTPAAATGPHALTYRLAWSRAGTTPLPDGRGFEVTTDQGYRVRTTRGWLVSETMAFLACHPDELASPAIRSGVARIVTWALAPRRAEAGHELARMNPARLSSPHVESVIEARTLDAGSVTPPAARYCTLHYLVARAAGDARGLPADVDMLGASLELDGAWQAPGGGPWHPFRLRTDAANGLVAPVRPAVDAAAAGATATVTRKLGTLYDGIDFTTAPAKAQAWQILKNVIASTTIRISGSP